MDSIIHQEAVIGDNCTIHNAIIGKGVVINNDCAIKKGTIITERVVVKEGIKTIPPGSICSLYTFNADEEKFGEAQASEYNTDYFEKGLIPYVPREAILKESEMLGAGCPFQEEESDLEEQSDDELEDPLADFTKELDDLFQNFLQKQGQSPGNQFMKSLIMEIKSLRLTNNINSTDVVNKTFNMVMDSVLLKQIESTQGKASQVAKAIQGTLDTYIPIFEEFVNGDSEQATLINEIEKLCASKDSLKAMFHIFMQCLFKQEILGKQAVKKWGERTEQTIKMAGDAKGGDEDSGDLDEDEIDVDKLSKFYKDMEKFLSWLNKPDESSSEDESSSDDKDSKSSKSSGSGSSSSG